MTPAKTIQIGSVASAGNVFLAPLSGVSDMPFRRLAKRYGCGMVFSEMIASREMLRANDKTRRMLTNCAEEHPMAVQLAGCEPEVMAEAARMNEDRGAALIDINMGCPAKKIVTSWSGSALMRDEDNAVRIIEATVKAVKVPVTLKMRLGWDANNLNAPSLARKAEEVGVKMITIHGRTREQLFNGKADWSAIRRVKEAVKIPLIGNGDVLTPEDAVELLKTSGADGVMIGRGSFGKPWLPSQVQHYLSTGEKAADPTSAEKCALVLEHYDALLSHYGLYKGIRIARKHLAWYAHGQRNANAFRVAVNTEEEPAKVRAAVRMLFDGPAVLQEAA